MSEQRSIVFLIYHGMGHFNACFRLAKILKKKHEVVFAGIESFKKYVESQGFMYYLLKTVPFGMGFEDWVNKQEKRKNVYWSTLKDRWMNRLYALREKELHQLLHDIEPDYLLIDSFQSTDFIAAYPYLRGTSSKVGFIQTMLPMTIKHNCPPLNSGTFPDDIKGIKKAIKNVRRERVKKYFQQKVFYFGCSDDVLIKKQIKKNGLEKLYPSTFETLRGISFINLPELILALREFDFKNNAAPNSHYIGFMPDLQRLEIAHVEYFKVDSLIRSKLKDTNGTLLYCSFGTVKSTDTRLVNQFLQKLINVVRDTNCVLIISSNSIHHDSTFVNIPENVFLLKAAPQLEILARADVFITHGGLNSLRESIYAGVPMLVYPPNKVYDNMGNSTRVVYHKIGLRGDLQQDSEQEISDKIEDLINNDIFKKNIQMLKEIDREYLTDASNLLHSLQSV